MAQIDDDMIPDPNAALFTDDNFNPRLILQFMSSVAQSVASQGEGFKVITAQMDKQSDAIKQLATSVQKLVEAEQKRELDKAEFNHRIAMINGEINNRREEIKEVKNLAIKALDKADGIQNGINNSCDIMEVKVDKKIKEKVDGLYTNVKIIWIAAGIIALLGGTIYNDMKQSIYKLEHIK